MVLNNKSLQNDLDNLDLNFTTFEKSSLGKKNTITTLENNSPTSYVYKSKKARDEDYKQIQQLLIT